VPVIIWINGGFGAGKTTLAARQPGGTLLLRSDRLTPAELADEVLATADLRQVHGDPNWMRS
jgi:adenylylsulfate kinase-like enzyme